MNFLDDLCEFIVDCEHKTAPIQEEGIPSIRTPNIGRGYFILDGVNRVSEATFDLWTRRVVPEAGDLILAREAPVGNVAVIPADLKCCLGQRTVLMRPKQKDVDSDYLCYLLLTPALQADLLGKSGGATVHHLNLKDIRALPIPQLPTPDVQKTKASIIKAYDDLIEINRRRIELLEESARLLYREWFENFRFPGFETSEMVGSIPMGWQFVAFSTAADFVNGFAFKPEHLKEEGLPIVKIPELRDGVNARTPRNHGGSVPERNKIDTGDLLFSWSATLLVNEWFDGPALLNQHLFKVNSRVSFYKRYLRFALEAAIPALLGQSVGATMQHIRKSALDDRRVLVPREEVRTSFSRIVDPICDQVITLRRQVNALSVARDELLPKLMSGAIQV